MRAQNFMHIQLYTNTQFPFFPLCYALYTLYTAHTHIVFVVFRFGVYFLFDIDLTLENETCFCAYFHVYCILYIY